MTVSTAINQNQSIGNGSVVDFTFQFPYQTTGQVKVFVDGAEQSTSNYTIAPASGQNGTVTFNSAPANAASITILRQTDYLQETDYQNNDALDAETLEGNFDKLTYSVLQLKERVERSVRFDETLTGSNNPIINLDTATRAGKLLSFDANGAFTVSQEIGVFRGDYQSGIAYNARDIVKANNTNAAIEDNVYFCIGAVTTSENTDYTILQNTAKFSLLIDAVGASAAQIAAEAAKTAAESARDDAQTAETNAVAAYDNFDDRYLGAKSSDPTVDNDGNTLLDGALYFNSTSNVMKVYDLGGTTWISFPDSAAISTVAGISANVTTVAGISGNVTTVAGISPNVSTVAGVSSAITTVAGISSAVSSVSSISADVSSVGAITADVTSVAGIGANVTSVANNSTNINTVAGISSNVTTVAGISSNVSTVAGISADITTVAGATANIGTVATNITDVNTFAVRYRIGSTDPTTSLDVGDLFYNSSSNQLKVYNGTGWEVGVAAGSGTLLSVNNLSDISNAATARQNLGVTDEAISFAIALG